MSVYANLPTNNSGGVILRVQSCLTIGRCVLGQSRLSSPEIFVPVIRRFRRSFSPGELFTSIRGGIPADVHRRELQAVAHVDVAEIVNVRSTVLVQQVISLGTLQGGIAGNLVTAELPIRLVEGEGEAVAEGLRKEGDVVILAILQGRPLRRLQGHGLYGKIPDGKLRSV